jgi:Zn-dependent protease
MLNLSPLSLIGNLITLIISLTIHEFSHAWMAVRLGDDTPRLAGRLTLNPLKHLDLIGSLMLLVAGFGWAKPVPINPYALKQRSSAGVMWVSLAGPLSNFLLAVFTAILLRFLLIPQYNLHPSTMFNNVLQVVFIFYELNLVLMLFNLLPIAPLDGEKIAEYILPPKWTRVLEIINPYGAYILLALIVLPSLLKINIIQSVINPVLTNLTKILIGVNL